MKKEDMLLIDVLPSVKPENEPPVTKSAGKKVPGERGFGRKLCFLSFVLIILAVAVLFGMWKYNKSKERVAEELEQQKLFDIENEFFKDLQGVGSADYVSVTGLAKGSDRSQRKQKNAVEELGIPLEVKNRFTGIRFRLIPSGSFIMGSSLREPGRDSDEKQHEVAIDEPFYCSKFEITQRQWRKIMGSKKACFVNAGRSAPVENVSWGDAHRFIDALCFKSGVTNITYRLLTEAQWEYACRAGTYSSLYTGDITIQGLNNAPELDGIGWYAGNSSVNYEEACDSSSWPEKQIAHTQAGTHLVGEKTPNAFGLYDMIGNAWEWCGDWYDEYPGSYTNNPHGPKYGHYKAIRGGAWNSPAHKCRSADRDRGLPAFNDPCLGFRIMRVIRFKPYPSNAGFARNTARSL